MVERLLLADVGGTNTRVGTGGLDGLDPESVASFRNADYPDLAAILASYLSQYPGPNVAALCAGVAGPVRGGTAQLTNRDWLINAEELRAATDAGQVQLINDLQAQAYALGDLPAGSVSELFEGAIPADGASRLVMGLGTGCNIAVAHQTPDGVLVPASETGHSSLPYLNGDAGRLIAHLSQTHFHRPVEAALSGPGLARIYRYISGQTLPPEGVIRAYVDDEPDATSALSLFMEILGTVAGNIALAHLPMGGFYFIGGTARAVAPHLKELGFRDHFIAKGPYTPILRDITVRLVTDDSAALRGCARCLLQTGAFT